MSDYIIKATNIRKYFGGVKALDGVSLEIKKGEITGYSMAGIADIAKQEEKPVSQEKHDEKGLFNLLKSKFIDIIFL